MQKVLKRNIYYTLLYKLILPVCFIGLVISSCSVPKQVIYFEKGKKDSIARNLVDENLEFKIRKNDVISINISSLSAGESSLYNSSAGAGSASAAGGGYLVDKEGNIEIIKLGTIHAEGLTRKELKIKLQRDLLPYLKDPVVTIRFLNQRAIVLGEVGSQKTVDIPNERISLLELIALSGGIPDVGRKDNILLIRQTENHRIFKRIDLTDNSIFTSPYYYIQPDDIVYVEPSKLKAKNSAQTQQIISYSISILSILLIILDRLKL
jgi:polysaccharide export outer membrane protein